MKLANFFSVSLAVLLFCGALSAQTELDRGLQLYKSGNFNAALDAFKKATKADSGDFQGWCYLGLTYLKQGEVKDSIKALNKAAQLGPNELTAHVGLGYAYLLQNKLAAAQAAADRALKLEPKSAEAHYIYGVVNYRNASYAGAYERANRAVELEPNFPMAYLLKAQTLVVSFVQQSNTVIKPPGSKYGLLKDAEESLAKYLSLSPPSEETKFYTEYLESIKFFSDYYNAPDYKPPPRIDAVGDGGISPLKVISKPRALFTDSARRAGVEGTTRLMVGFSANGTVSHVLVIKPLSHGLGESAVRAARGIKFEPATRDGKPVSVVRNVEYHFNIH
jgi:TonB family protein